MASSLLHDQLNRAGEPRPALEFLRQLLPARRAEAVRLRLAPGLGHDPVRLEPALLFQAMQGRIQRPLRHLQHVAADELDSAGNRPPVLRAAGERLEDEQVERALDEVGRSAHIVIPRLSTVTPRLSTIRAVAQGSSLASKYLQDR